MSHLALICWAGFRKDDSFRHSYVRPALHLLIVWIGELIRAEGFPIATWRNIAPPQYKMRHQKGTTWKYKETQSPYGEKDAPASHRAPKKHIALVYYFSR